MGVPLQAHEYPNIGSYKDIGEGDAQFISDLRELLCSVKKAQIGKGSRLLKDPRSLCSPRSGHMTKYLYSDIITEDRTCGKDLFQRVLVHGNPWYYIPGSEARGVDNNSGYLSNLYALPPVVVDLGSGTEHAVMTKLIPTLKYVHARACLPYDFNVACANNAASLVKTSIPAIDVRPVHGDFTRAEPLTLDAPILMTMFGCTLSQFPFEETSETGETTFEAALTSIGQMVNFNCLLIASIDTNSHPADAVDCYSGRYMSEFQRHLWSTAKCILKRNGGSIIIDGDEQPNPADAVIYNPELRRNSVHHLSTLKKNMTFTLASNEKSILLSPGCELDIGGSEKWSDIDEIAVRAPNGGFELVNELHDGRSTVRFLVLAGKNVSPEQKARASFIPAKALSPEGLVARASVRYPTTYRGRAGFSVGQPPI